MTTRQCELLTWVVLVFLFWLVMFGPFIFKRYSGG